jgi:UDP-2,3-diacylglucosamine pyrophosphatase LpxH
VIHGDHFDLVVTQARWLAHLGDYAYTAAIAINRVFNSLRRRFGFGYWSLSQWAKHKVKNAVNYIGEFEKTLVIEARRNAADGVICGHIHHATIHNKFGITYLNCGDWVESCTAIAEHPDGRFEIITWTTMSPYGDSDREMEGEAEIAHAARGTVAGASDLVDAV